MLLHTTGSQVERWGVFEVSATGKTEGNPFTDYEIGGIFTSRNESVEVSGFYDGDGVYKVRFMPSFEEPYTYRIFGTCLEDEITGTFSVTAPGQGNHGPVYVCNTLHFAYADGTPFYPVGTTSYVWTHQAEEIQQDTLRTLQNGYFNKIRFCVFPKHYDYNFNDPITFPYEGKPMDSSVLTSDNFSQYGPRSEGNTWNFHRFNPAHFQHLERRILDLQKIGVEADLILLHPYDRWGFSIMPQDCDDLYIRYVVARFAAYRNVWWSLANEYDFMEKTTADWERIADIICRKDPYRHLRSIHNAWHNYYNFNRPWVTHCSMQTGEIEKTGLWREIYGKPVLVDETGYEGNLEHGWGNHSPEEMVRRFWEVTMRGGYATHGETYANPERILWWSRGGTLHGESAPRLKFLHDEILEKIPGPGLKPANILAFPFSATVDDWLNKGFYLAYFGISRPSYRHLPFSPDTRWHVELIDTWNMTVEDLGEFSGNASVSLPGRAYIALRIRRV